MLIFAAAGVSMPQSVIYGSNFGQLIVDDQSAVDKLSDNVYINSCGTH